MGCPGLLALTGWLGTMDRSADVKVHQHSPVVYLIDINELMPRAWDMSECEGPPCYLVLPRIE